MWQRRYSNEEILDEAGLTDVFTYLTENSVKEGLVSHPSRWRGLHGHHQLVDQRQISGAWVDRSSLYRAKQSDSTRDQISPDDFTTLYDIKLTQPSFWEEMNRHEYRDHCKRLAHQAIQSARSKRKGKPKPLGMSKVLAQSVHKTRTIKQRSNRPLCRTKCLNTLKQYREQYLQFKKLFREAYRRLRELISTGIMTADVVFPEGGVPPLCLRSP